MTTIADGTRVTHSNVDATAVGWLDPSQPHATGSVDSAFFSALVRLAANPWQPTASAGHHACGFCRFTGGPGSVSHDGVTVVLGAAELWIPSDTAIFWAPVTIVHYIDAHGYRPPDAFVDAVRACPPMRSMAYLRALRAHGMSAKPT
ncbi:MAG: hypothetical protein H6720_21775 [Sandaracinus sp.]|nr:hypothetical protein [Sandaracinus sp.]